MNPLAAIYSRISRDPEGRQAGVQRQEQDCRRMAADRGWTVLRPVYDRLIRSRSKPAEDFDGGYDPIQPTRTSPGAQVLRDAQ